METYREEEACRLREEEERQKKKAEETMKRVSEALEHLSHRQDLLLPRDGKRYRDESSSWSQTKYRSPKSRRRN